MKIQLKADLMLVAVALFWGSSFLLTDYALEELDPFNINALRFIIAFLGAFILASKRLRPINKITLKYSALLGSILTIVYLGATFGVKYTSLSNAGFLGALTVVITPVLAFIFKKQRAEAKLLFSVLLSLAGIALLTFNEHLRPAIGDIFSIFSAIFYAVHLLVTEAAVKKEGVNVFQMGVYQLAFCGVCQLFLSYITEAPRLPSSGKVWISILTLAIFCTGFSFIIQSIAQQHTTASHVGVIYSLEPVFAALIAFFIAGEVLSARAYFGAFLLLVSILIIEIDLKALIENVKIRIKQAL